MKITSPSFRENGMIPERFTCEEEDVNPSFQIYAVPLEAKSLAIMMHDHDAPSGDFVHWLIWNIDPEVGKISESMTPIGAQEGTNDFGEVGWGGPCPPSGMHRYEFHFYALSISIDLPSSGTKNDLRDLMDGYILDEASIVGLYKKQN